MLCVGMCPGSSSKTAPVEDSVEEPTDQLREQNDSEHQSGYKLFDVCASEMFFFRFEWATMPVTLIELTLRSQNTGQC